MMQPDSILIGLDGGGTSCRAALVRGDGSGRIEMTGGPANVSDFAGAMTRVRDLVLRLAAAAGIDSDELGGAAVHAGFAGVMDDMIAARVAAELPFARVTVTDDQPTMIAGALGARDGAVAAIGTGSFVGRQSGGAIHVLGGWGFALGDQASGAWLGRSLLSAALLAGDGIAPGSALTNAISTRLGGAPGMVAFALSSAPNDYAALAPEVVAAATEGDAVAARLMGEGAAYIESALAALGFSAGDTLCLAGGLGPAYGQWLSAGTAAGIAAPQGTALDGALALAARAAEGAPA